MSLDPAIFRALVAQGATPEMLLAVVEADASVREAKLEKKRTNNAVRQQRHRDKLKAEAGRNADNALQPVTERDGSLEVSPQTPLPNPSSDIPPLTPRAGGRSGKHLLPADWVLPTVAELPPKAKACAEQWTDASYSTHGEAFVSYWRGEGRMKSDWRGTWANRVIALHSQVLRDQKFGNAPTSAASPNGSPAEPADFKAFALRSAEKCRAMGREREALDWEAKAKGEEPRRGSTGPPRAVAELIPANLRQAATA